MEEIIKKREANKKINRKTNSRLDFPIEGNNLLKSKRSQLTIFIILALVIVAILMVLFYPRLKVLILGPSPTDFIKKCAEDATEEVLEKIKVQGGSLEPENYILYNGEKVEYVCYINEYYKNCIMQKPFLKQDIEKEITAYIEPRIKECFSSLEQELEKRGSSVSLKDIDVQTSLIPNSILININAPMTVSRGGTSLFERFKVDIDSQLYDLVMLASSISNYEARYGDSETLTYMLYYPDIRVEKKEQSDGSRIYILTYKPTNEQFIFASRSIAWPPGYTGA